MAPKKKQQQRKKPNAKGSSSSSSSSTSRSKDAPKVQISAENERRLRRLLLNTERPSPSPSPSNPPDSSASSSTSQRAKRLRNVYDKLSLEGFTSDQIERALSALNDGATLESTLDWLCLNLPENELPLKFSRGAISSARDGREPSVTIISTARNDWIPSNRTSENTDNMNEISIKRSDHLMESLDLCKSAQADWIRQYMEQQELEEEDEQKNEEDKSEVESSWEA